MHDIEKLKALPRKHAPYFEWHTKETKELGVVNDFFACLEKKTGTRLVEIELGENPPDVRITTDTGQVIGVEVTELVNEKAIHYQIQKDPRYVNELLSWTKETTISRVQSIIDRKSRLCEAVSIRYEKAVLVIFTDEPQLDAEKFRDLVQGHQFRRPQSFDEVHVLFGYNPKKGSMELLQLG